MEAGNTSKNLNSLGWDTLEERRLKTKLTIFQKGRLGDIDIPTDHLALVTRPTRRGGGGPIYQKEFSNVEAHRSSFYPSTTRLWNKLPVELKTCDNMDFFTNKIKNINISELRHNLLTID